MNNSLQNIEIIGGEVLLNLSESGLFMQISDEIFCNAGKYFNLEPTVVEKYFFADVPEK